MVLFPLARLCGTLLVSPVKIMMTVMNADDDTEMLQSYRHHVISVT